MNLHKIIFSKTSPSRYYRHILFWLVMFLFFFVFDNIVFIRYKGLAYAENLVFIFKYQLSNIKNLIIDMVYTYMVVYVLIPKFFVKRKYFSFSGWLVSVTLIAYLIDGFGNIWFNKWINKGQNNFQEINTYEEVLRVLWNHTIGFFISAGAISRCCLFLACKMLKNYYEKMEEKTSLVIENANAELQLLKAQVHPHFLFNTLNNIYSLALNKSLHGGGLVTKLSDTLHYMVNECNADLVPFEKELKMIRDYIEIEKIRYDNRLSIELNVQGDYENKSIAPLLLIPFVENSFKHGTSQVLLHPWIKLALSIEKNHCLFKLSNSKPLHSSSLNGKNGIGLKNVQKRLKLLYPAQHELIIDSTADVFSVEMRVPLQDGHAGYVEEAN